MNLQFDFGVFTNFPVTFLKIQIKLQNNKHQIDIKLD